MRRGSGPRKLGVRARTRHPDRLAFVIDPEGDSDSVAGERMEFPNLVLPRPPYHGFIIENLRPAAVERHSGWALWIAGVLLRVPRHLALIVDGAVTGVDAS